MFPVAISKVLTWGYLEVGCPFIAKPKRAVANSRCSTGRGRIFRRLHRHPPTFVPADVPARVSGKQQVQVPDRRRLLDAVPNQLASDIRSVFKTRRSGV